MRKQKCTMCSNNSRPSSVLFAITDVVPSGALNYVPVLFIGRTLLKVLSIRAVASILSDDFANGLQKQNPQDEGMGA
ncbi:MAG: hypothetical protein A2W68_01315 [Betaproteobacteria bacterium RIFCSPLOWO2_02_64_14]|nr:MAG: hypothetical protein A2W68_01315 [Betaproteobacteria bacterium RIFCSPLOWO2_02_64_14]